MNAPKVRLFMPGLLVQGKSLGLSKDQIHYLANVLRLSTGSKISLFNEEFGEWVGELIELTKKLGVIRINHQLKPSKMEYGVWLAFSPLKKSRTDFIVEKATELGIERLIPVFTEFTVPSRVNLLRLSAVAREAAEQCGRLSIPLMRKTFSLTEFIKWWPIDRLLFYGDETGNGVSLKAAIEEKKIEGNKNCGFLIGPEGGFSQYEHANLSSISRFQAIDLGPRVLRAETAAIAAISAWEILNQ